MPTHAEITEVRRIAFHKLQRLCAEKNILSFLSTHFIERFNARAPHQRAACSYLPIAAAKVIERRVDNTMIAIYVEGHTYVFKYERISTERPPQTCLGRDATHRLNGVTYFYNEVYHPFLGADINIRLERKKPT